MKRAHVAVAVAVFGAILPRLACAQWDGAAVAEALGKVAARSGFLMERAYPAGEAQIAIFRMEGGLEYWLDLKARLCFAGVRSEAGEIALTAADCGALKRGYPLMAPLISWEK